MRPLIVLILAAILATLEPPRIVAQQLSLSWTDNTGGFAHTRIERRVGTTGVFSQIAEVLPGVVVYVDRSVLPSTLYCYRVAAVGDDAVVSPFSNVACGTPAKASLNTAVYGNGKIVSSPTGIVCPTICSLAFWKGTTVTLTATPNTGSHFVRWSNSCQVQTISTTGGTCKVWIFYGASITATFATP